MPVMVRRGSIPTWLRRGLEGGLLAGIVAAATLLGSGLGPDAQPRAMAPGPAGTIVLAAPVLSLAVLAISYPLVMAATRFDAVLGAVAAFLIAADLVVLAGGRLLLGNREQAIGTGLFVVLLALGPAVVGLAAGELLSPVGFGRRAGSWSAVTAAAVSVVALAIALQVL
jgi:hypothetical protein